MRKHLVPTAAPPKLSQSGCAINDDTHSKSSCSVHSPWRFTLRQHFQMILLMHSFAFCVYPFKLLLRRSALDKSFKMGLTSSMMAAGSSLRVCRCLEFLLSLLSCTDSRNQGKSCELVVHQFGLCERKKKSPDRLSLCLQITSVVSAFP